MFTKTIVRAAAFSFIFLPPFITTSAQQRKFIEGLPFTFNPRTKNIHPLTKHNPYRSCDDTGNNIDP
jgi:hypothetical protein